VFCNVACCCRAENNASDEADDDVEVSCVAVCCSMLQCVAVMRCHVLQCVAVMKSSVLRCVAVYRHVLQCSAGCCCSAEYNALDKSDENDEVQCVAVCCSELQYGV